MHMHILNVWRHIKNPTPSTDAYVLEKQSCQGSSRSIWNDGDLDFLKSINNNNDNDGGGGGDDDDNDKKDMGSVSDSKLRNFTFDGVACMTQFLSVGETAECYSYFRLWWRRLVTADHELW